jgi:hypothetical protein
MKVIRQTAMVILWLIATVSLLAALRVVWISVPPETTLSFEEADALRLEVYEGTGTIGPLEQQLRMLEAMYSVQKSGLMAIDHDLRKASFFSNQVSLEVLCLLFASFFCIFTALLLKQGDFKIDERSLREFEKIQHIDKHYTVSEAGDLPNHLCGCGSDQDTPVHLCNCNEEGAIPNNLCVPNCGCD